LLDGIDSREGQIVIIPGPAQPASPPAGQATQTPGGQPAQTPGTSPVAQSGSGGSFADAIRAALASGVYLTPPAAGTPTATVLEDIAKQCQKPAAEVQKAMRSLSRSANMAKQPLASLDKKENGSLFAISVAPPASKMPDALACIALAKPPEAVRIDLVASAREFGPIDAPHIEAAAHAQLAKDLNAAFGDPARPWRLATIEELLAILPVLFDENLWGPDGGRFWTSNILANGQRVIVEAKTEKQDYRAALEAVDSTAKAAPIWVRSRK